MLRYCNYPYHRTMTATVTMTPQWWRPGPGRRQQNNQCTSTAPLTTAATSPTCEVCCRCLFIPHSPLSQCIASSTTSPQAPRVGRTWPPTFAAAANQLPFVQIVNGQPDETSDITRIPTLYVPICLYTTANLFSFSLHRSQHFTTSNTKVESRLR